jgi:hypothetical protein
VASQKKKENNYRDYTIQSLTRQPRRERVNSSRDELTSSEKTGLS